MPATVSKPIPRLFSLILIFLLVLPIHVNVTANASPSCIFFFNLAACNGNIHYFMFHAIDSLGGGYRRNTHLQRSDDANHVCFREQFEEGGGDCNVL